ncbi:tRNA (adenosine(37)-N6)-dimethylallyltransferase MiaA [Halocynthiibacter sp.]|uniref:tRNA (adenosine(37)-N6)-dimethylallyltransferase MiaA n=1 Tax=Halocynthiibacter sp. TaxID=1979210 RepID=UPI003C640546
MRSLPFDIPDDMPVLIAGPTASGKSALALEIVERGGGIIVNADALQVYSGWRILTARPSDDEEARAPHRLYGHVPFDQDYSVGAWLRDIAPFIGKDQPRPVIVGGTGLYFRALCEGLAEIPPTSTEIRAEADALLASGGLDTMIAELDVESAARIDLQNPVRVQRAWEVLRATGRGIASWQDDTPPPLLPVTDTFPIVMNTNVDWLNARIEKRFDLMLDGGALEEARMMEPHWDPALLSSRAIGAPELMSYLHANLTLDEARNAAVISSRQYAKRQRTWFRKRMSGWNILDLPGESV